MSNSCLDKAFPGTVVNLTLQSFNGRSPEITRTVPLNSNLFTLIYKLIDWLSD